jgi:hypothetical protein
VNEDGEEGPAHEPVDPIYRMDQMIYKLETAVYQRGEILKLLRAIIVLQGMVVLIVLVIAALAFIR